MHLKPYVVVSLNLLLMHAAGAQACEYSVTRVSHQDIVANLYLPKTAANVPVVIAVGGSEGGLSTGDANGEMLAPHCLAVLGLAYFKEAGIAQTLDQIPLEYFIRAIDYLHTLPAIDPSRIGMVGGSRGAELALLLASIEPRIKSVVATTPSSVAWYGRTLPKSAWTLRGKDIPALRLGLDEQAPMLARFEAALRDPQQLRQSMFALEKINGPLLLISAENDQVWPSYRMARDIVVYLAEHQFKFAVTHRSYATGHGFSRETAPAIKQSIVDHFVKTL